MTDTVADQNAGDVPSEADPDGVNDAGGSVPDESPEFEHQARTQSQMVIRRFVRHRLAMASLAVLILMILLAFVGLSMWKHSFEDAGLVQDGGRPTLDIIPFLDGDGLQLGEHPFGQDNIGRDYFAVTLRGAQNSLQIAFVAGLLATFLGTLVGGLAGYYRGIVDSVLMRFVDVMFTVPLLLVAAVLSRRFNSDSIIVVALIIALASWLTTARIIRAEFLSLREKEFVEADRALGASNLRIMVRHVLPNTIGSVIVTATLLISASILVETALSFLGLGVRGSDFSLGKQVSQYQTAFNTRPWLFWYPGLFIVIIALCINFIGDGLRDAFDPRQNRTRQ